MSLVGYVRVSSSGQNLDRQIQAIGNVDELFEEKQSGKNINDRPVFQECMKYLRKGDTLLVHSIDRAARSVIDLHSIVDTLKEKRVCIKFLKENLTFTPDSCDATSTLYLSLLGAISQFERSLIKERQREGIAAAKALGKPYGRNKTFTDEQCKIIAKRINAGEKVAILAKEFKVSRNTIYNSVKRA